MEDKQPCRPEQASRALFAREAGEKGRRRRRRRDSAGRRNILSAARLDARGIYRTYPARILRAIFFSPNFEKSSNRRNTFFPSLNLWINWKRDTGGGGGGGKQSEKTIENAIRELLGIPLNDESTTERRE